MTVSENIFASVFIVLLTIILGIFIYTESVNYSVNEYELEKNEFVYDMYSNDFNSVLLITENISKRSMGNLLANALYYNTEVLNFSNNSINVTKDLKEILDTIYGEDKYYFEIKPRIVDVSLNFIIDGSDSLEDERLYLGTKLHSLMQEIKEQIKETGDEVVIANIYILGDKTDSNDNKKCLVFDTVSSQITCTIIGKEELYDRRNSTYSDFRFSENETDVYKTTYNITPPYNNLSYVRLIRKQGEKDYYEADWGNGVSYVSSISKGSAKLVIIFPMSDELSTSSISEKCFTIETNSEQKICDICEKSCDSSTTTPTENRSMETIKKASIISKDNQHIVNPIFAYSCDYDYKPIFNTYYELIHKTPTTNACQETQCPGCSLESSSTSNVCFHPECKDEILSQMTYIADYTNGKVINLENIEELVYNVHGVINESIQSFKISIGKPINNSEKYVIRRKVPLPNKLMTDLRIEILADRKLYENNLEGGGSETEGKDVFNNDNDDDKNSENTKSSKNTSKSDDEYGLKNTLTVGSDETYKTPSSAIKDLSDGDILIIKEGVYSGDFATIDKNDIVIKGEGKVVLDATGKNIPNKKGIWVIKGDNIVVDNIEFKGAKVPDKNGAGIRMESKNLTVKNSYFHENEMGILTHNKPNSVLTIENSHFAYNGYGDGYSHNIYVGSIKKFTIKYSYSHHSKIGHTIKTRADENYILYNKLQDGTDGTSSYLIDIPNGGESYIIGNIIQQGPKTDNPHMISYAAEGAKNPIQKLYISSNTFVNTKTSGNAYGIRVANEPKKIVIVNNIFSNLANDKILISSTGNIDNNIIVPTSDFNNPNSFDYTLKSTSTAIDTGIKPTINFLIPKYEYKHIANSVNRKDDGKIDFGAFEN